MSKVKVFNLRFRARHFAGDPDVLPPPESLISNDDAVQYYVDPRDSKGFKEIDHLVCSFVDSFPKECRDPSRDGVLDIHLLLANLVPNV